MDPAKSKYHAMTVVQLKAELRTRNAQLSGRKKDLIERLESYDRNFNFGAANTVGPEFKMTLPDKSLYKDVNGDSKVPHVKEVGLHSYLENFNASLNDKVKGFYKDQFLSYVRHVTVDDLTFIHTKCYAEMKKAVAYYVDLSVDENGVIKEAQCDCGAGEGPGAHCKHVQTSVWALIQWAVTKSIITEETCTQVLQTFHKVKKLTGSPCKTIDLELCASGSNENFDFEPRPAKYVKNEAYEPFVRNLLINFPHDHPMPLEQIIEPANPYAVNLDHTYAIINSEEQFLHHFGLTQISPAKISSIEEATRLQNKSRQWKDERVMRLTSSNFHRVCTATERTELSKLAYDLTLLTNAKSAAINHGNQYEHVAVEKFEKAFSTKTEVCGMFVCESDPYLAASPDRLLGDDTVVEVKCPYNAREQKITPVTVPWLKVENGSLQLNTTHRYYYQIQGQLLCTKRARCILVVYTFKDMRCFVIERNDQFIANMVSKLSEFYRNYFKDAVFRRFLYKDYYGYSFQADNVY